MAEHSSAARPRIARKFAAAAVVARHAEEYPHPRDPARTDRELRELTLATSGS